MAKVTYKVWYKIEDKGTQVQVTLLVKDSFNEIIVAQDEGTYKDMEDAKYLIEYLENIGAEIEYVKAETKAS